MARAFYEDMSVQGLVDVSSHHCPFILLVDISEQGSFQQLVQCVASAICTIILPRCNLKEGGQFPGCACLTCMGSWQQSRAHWQQHHACLLSQALPVP